MLNVRPLLSIRLLALASLTLLSLSAIPSLAFLGDTVDEAKKTDFFTFFRLLEAKQEKGKGDSLLVTYQPLESAKFRDLVKLIVSVGPDKRIGSTELVVARPFIDDPVQGIFARDLCKSFLRGSVKSGDTAAIADLSNEIEWRAVSNVIVGRAPPALPKEPSAGYHAFLGKTATYEQKLPTSILKLENVKRNDSDWLVISLAPR